LSSELPARIEISQRNLAGAMDQAAGERFNSFSLGLG
jgi:hypothetical protein